MKKYIYILHKKIYMKFLIKLVFFTLHFVETLLLDLDILSGRVRIRIFNPGADYLPGGSGRLRSTSISLLKKGRTQLSQGGAMGAKRMNLTLIVLGEGGWVD